MKVEERRKDIAAGKGKAEWRVKTEMRVRKGVARGCKNVRMGLSERGREARGAWRREDEKGKGGVSVLSISLNDA